VTILLEAIPKDKDKTEFIADYINEVYGKVNKDNVAAWFNMNFQSKD